MQVEFISTKVDVMTHDCLSSVALTSGVYVDCVCIFILDMTTPPWREKTMVYYYYNFNFSIDITLD